MKWSIVAVAASFSVLVSAISVTSESSPRGMPPSDIWARLSADDKKLYIAKSLDPRGSIGVCTNWNSIQQCQSHGSGWSANADCSCKPPANTCQTMNGWNNCWSKWDSTWGCASDCQTCTPPPGACQNVNQWQTCKSQGKGCNSACQCTCTQQAISDCQNKKGQLQSDCSCLVSTSWKKRDVPGRTRMCPIGYSSCPVKDAKGKVTSYECLDTDRNIDSCGGCESEGAAMDCSALDGVTEVSCVKGHCFVYACERGWELRNNTGCVPVEASRQGLFSSALSQAENIMRFSGM